MKVVLYDGRTVTADVVERGADDIDVALVQAKVTGAPALPLDDLSSVKIGSWVFSSRLHGTDPATSTTPDDGDAQAEHAYRNAQHLVELAGGTLANITQITAFVRDQDGAQLAERHFQRVFGDSANRPAFWAVNAFIRPQMKLMVEFVATL